MDTTDLLDQGFAWTAARIAAVPADGLDGPTPCGRWSLRELLDHTTGVLTMITDAVAGDVAADPDGVRPLGPTSWDLTIAELIVRSRVGWDGPGVMNRVFVLPFGTMPGSVLVSVGLLESVVHGWDIGQATGEGPDIPGALARPILEFARGAIADGDRGDNFAADLGIGDSPFEQLVAFLGRKPR